MYCIIKSKSCYIKCNMKCDIIYIKYKMVIIFFMRIFEKEKLCEISLQCIKSIYFYSSVHFYIDCWICREVSK